MCIQSNHLLDYRQLLRFGLVGVLNTLAGYSVILIALWLGYGDIAANAVGYAAGLALSFMLNSRWTFETAARFSAALVARYAAAFIFAYAVNLMVVIEVRSTGLLANWANQLAGICVYTILFYLASVYFVFPKRLAIPESSDGAIQIQSGHR